MPNDNPVPNPKAGTPDGVCVTISKLNVEIIFEEYHEDSCTVQSEVRFGFAEIYPVPEVSDILEIDGIRYTVSRKVGQSQANSVLYIRRADS